MTGEEDAPEAAVLLYGWIVFFPKVAQGASLSFCPFLKSVYLYCLQSFVTSLSLASGPSDEQYSPKERKKQYRLFSLPWDLLVSLSSQRWASDNVGDGSCRLSGAGQGGAGC